MGNTRDSLVRRGLRLNVATIAYNSLEAVISLVAGVMAGSVALVGFGVDSVIEVTASGAAHWRLRADWDPARRERVWRGVWGAEAPAGAPHSAVDPASPVGCGVGLECPPLGGRH